VRALGASRGVILTAFVGEALALGSRGVHRAAPRPLHGTGAVRLMAVTVESLYVSSRPGSIELNAASVCSRASDRVGVRLHPLIHQHAKLPWFRPSRPWRADAANTMYASTNCVISGLLSCSVWRQPQLPALPLLQASAFWLSSCDFARNRVSAGDASVRYYAHILFLAASRQTFRRGSHARFA